MSEVQPSDSSALKEIGKGALQAWQALSEAQRRKRGNADGGILYEPRDFLGLAYRTRESMYRQTARLELDYAAAHLGSGEGGLEPTDDDQQTRNDITVKREGGSSYRASAETGPLSVNTS